jgi:hypothetical protein
MKGPGEVKFSEEQVIRTPRPLELYAVRKNEWEWLRESVTRLPPTFRWLPMFGSLLVGAGISAGIAAFGLYSTRTDDLASWVLPSTWCACGSLVIVGGVFLLMAQKDAAFVGTTTAAVLNLMERIEQSATHTTVTGESG